MSDRRRMTSLDPERGRAIRDRLLERATTSRAVASQFTTIRSGDGAWTSIVPGARAKKLKFPGSHSALVEIDAGATLPMHRHHEHEECFVLRGEVEMGDLRVYAREYHLAPAGTRHSAVRSRTGALLFLRGAPIVNLAMMARSVIAAWVLPPESTQAITIRENEGSWQEYLPGVEVKTYRQGEDGDSTLVRLHPGAALRAGAGEFGDEFVVVDGEAFFDDTLLRSGEYQFAPAGSQQRHVTSDVGALLYRRGRFAI